MNSSQSSAPYCVVYDFSGSDVSGYSNVGCFSSSASTIAVQRQGTANGAPASVSATITSPAASSIQIAGPTTPMASSQSAFSNTETLSTGVQGQPVPFTFTQSHASGGQQTAPPTAMSTGAAASRIILGDWAFAALAFIPAVAI